MSKITRREFLKAGAGAVAGGVLGVGAGVGTDDVKAAADTWASQVEKGAKLRVVRWNKFVQGDETLWMQNTKAASGARSPKEAAERAQKRAERYYKV